MRMYVYGPCEQDCSAVLITRSMLSSTSNTKAPLCGRMGSGLRFLVPDLPTYGDKTLAPYVSAAAETTATHQWLVSNGMSRLLLGFAASLGGVILFELLRPPGLSFDRLFIEEVSFYSGGPMARVGGAASNRAMVVRHRKAVRNPEAGVCKLQRLYGKEAARSMVVSFAAVSEDNIRTIVRDCSYVSLSPPSPVIQRRCTFTYGEKDSDLWLARRMIPRLYPEAELRVWPDRGHCERMSRDSVTYGAMLRNVVLGSVSTDCS